MHGQSIGLAESNVIRLPPYSAVTDARRVGHSTAWAHD